MGLTSANWSWSLNLHTKEKISSALLFDHLRFADSFLNYKYSRHPNVCNLKHFCSNSHFTDWSAPAGNWIVRNSSNYLHSYKDNVTCNSNSIPNSSPFLYHWQNPEELYYAGHKEKDSIVDIEVDSIRHKNKMQDPSDPATGCCSKI